MKIIRFITSFLLIVGPCLTTYSQDNPLKLWYTKSAEAWEESLPVGNGRLGAMIFGKTSFETLQLNEETVWAGEPGNNVVALSPEHLQEIRQAIFKEEYKKAQQLADEYLAKKDNNSGMSYQTVGDLTLNFPESGSVQDYYRDLDIGKAVSTVTYTIDNVHYKRRVISSFPDDVIMVELTASEPGSISFEMGLKSPQKKHNIQVKDDAVWLSGTTGDQENKTGKVKFLAIAKPKVEGGKIESTGNSLKISHANRAVIYISIATNFRSYKDLSGRSREQSHRIVEFSL